MFSCSIRGMVGDKMVAIVLSCGMFVFSEFSSNVLKR